MTIVELPDQDEGWAHLVTDGKLIAMLWIEALETPVIIGHKELQICVKQNGITKTFIYADAIRRE